MFLACMAILRMQSLALQPNCPMAPILSHLPLLFCCFSLFSHRLLVLRKAVLVHQAQQWLAWGEVALGSRDFLAWQDKIGVGCSGDGAIRQWQELLAFATCSLS